MSLYKNKYRIESIRAQWWDYSRNGSYFITICTRNRKHFFGEVQDKIMQLSDIGQIAHNCWMEIPQHFPFVKLGAFVVMPNHMHGIIIVETTLHATSPQVLSPQIMSPETVPPSSIPSKNESMARISPKQGTVATAIRSYKSAVTKFAHHIDPDFAWQSRYHDHIIRNDQEYSRIAEYIINNPLKWKDDTFHSK